MSGGTIELLGTGTGNFQRLRGTYDNGATTFNITYGTINARATAANTTGGNIRLSASLGVNTNFHLFAPAVLDLSVNDVISGSGAFTMDAGTGLRYANANGISASGATGAVQVSGTRAYSNGFYSLTGAAVNMITGSGLPSSIDTLVHEHAGDVTLTNALAVQKLRFAAFGGLLTGSNTIDLGTTGQVVNESATSSVLGRLQSTKTVSTNTLVTFGNIGLEVNAHGAAPGVVTALRKTGPGSIQNGYGGSHSIARVFRITPTVNTGLNADLTIRYFDSELNSIAEPLLTMFRSEDLGVTWEKVNSSYGNLATNSVSANGINAFSDWTLGDGSNPAAGKPAFVQWPGSRCQCRAYLDYNRRDR